MSTFNKIQHHNVKIAQCDLHVCSINGSDCPCIEDFYRVIAEGLELPDYFGYNLDSLEELLHDLSWINEKHILLFIYNAHVLLKDDNEKREQLLSLFMDIENERVAIVFND